MIEDNILFQECAEEYLSARKRDLRPTSYGNYRQMFESRIAPRLGGLRAKEVNQRTVQSFVNQSAQDGYCNHSIRDCVMLIKLILKYGCEQGYNENPAISVKYPKELRNKQYNYLSGEEFAKLYDYCVSNANYSTLPTLIAMTTGLRIGEVCALRYGDFNRETMTISVRRSVKRPYVHGEKSSIEISAPKTPSSFRDVPVGKEVAAAIEANRRADDIYISSGTGKPLEPRSYRAKYARILKKAGLSYHKFHDLRHTFASRCIEAGADARTTADLLGHANVEMTLNVYTHSSAERRRAVAEAACRL